MVDKKALRILYSKYWQSGYGWHHQEISEKDFLYAKEQGLMFDDDQLGHDEAIKLSVDICSAVSREIVVRSFLASLSSRRLDLRSNLASYACGQNLPIHRCSSTESDRSCKICGENESYHTIDLNVLNFERHKFGGVRHLSPVYIWFDLSNMNISNLRDPDDTDIKILNDILIALRELDSDKISDAQKVLSNIFSSNKTEREGIISTLGYCGILNVPAVAPFYEKYTAKFERGSSHYQKSDWPFPADLWIPRYGLREDSIEYWFGEYVA